VIEGFASDFRVSTLENADQPNTPTARQLPPRPVKSKTQLPRRTLANRGPTSTELLQDFISTNLPDFGSVIGANSNSNANEEKDALKKELKTFFFISPQDRIDDLEEEEESQLASVMKGSLARSTSQAISKVK
jgi:hypothetical protein